jgi:hypothetical protein
MSTLNTSYVPTMELKVGQVVMHMVTRKQYTIQGLPSREDFECRFIGVTE